MTNKSRNFVFACLLVLGTVLFVPFQAFALDNLLSLAPSHSEVVVKIDAESLAANPKIKEFIAESMGPEALQMTEAIKNLTDFDMFTDMQEVYVFGLINENKTNILAIRGTFNQKRLLGLVQLNGTFKEYEHNGQKVYYWNDNGEHYASFFGEDVLVLTSLEEAMREVVEAKSAPARSFLETAAYKSFPSGLNRHHAWIALIRTPTIDNDFGNFARDIDLRYALVTGDLNGEMVDLTLMLHPENPSLLDNYSRVADGTVALAELYAEKEEWIALFAEKAKVDSAPNKDTVDISATLEFDQTLEMIEKLK